MLHIVVEQTKEYPMRMRYDPQTGRFEQTPQRSLAAERNFTKPYGWIMESGTPPEPHWDCILMSDGRFDLGDVVAVRVIGVFKRNDLDHKYIAIEENRQIVDIDELPQAELEELHRLYPRVRDGEGWFGKEEAERLMQQGVKAL